MKTPERESFFAHITQEETGNANKNGQLVGFGIVRVYSELRKNIYCICDVGHARRQVLKRLIALSLVLMLFLAACQEVSEDTNPIPIADVEEPVISVAEEITDQEELEILWRDYLFFAIATVMNTEQYDSVAEIDPKYMIRYCWNQYVEEKGAQELEQQLAVASPYSARRLFPLEAGLEYVERYFDTRDIELDKLSDSLYNPDGRYFTLKVREREIPSYRDDNAWGMKLGKVLRYEDGRIEVEINQMASDRRDMVERVFTAKLAAREDGSLYFVSGGWRFLDNDSISMEGAYRELGILDKRFERVIGETDTALYLSNKETETPILVLAKESFEVINELSHAQTEYLRLPALDGDTITLYLEDSIEIYDLFLQPMGKIALPECLIPQTEEERIFGLDLSQDGERLVFADREGLKIYDLTEGQEHLLTPTMLGRGQPPDGKKNRYYFHPRFVGNGTKLIATLAGYDYNTGFFCYDMESGASQVVEEYFDGMSTEHLFQDTGMLTWIESLAREEEEVQDNPYFELYYYDFYSSETNLIATALKEEALNYVRVASTLYNGKHHVAFLTYTDNQDIIHVNRLDLSIWDVELDLLRLQGGRLNILGVLEDGSILFSYYRNPAENGLGLIP